MKALETHGRWPLVGSAALLPVAALAVGDPRLRPLAALLAHQTEEWVWPGGFLPWINQEVMGGDEEFPIDRRAGFLINVGFGWGLSAAVLGGPAMAGPQAALYVSHLGNAGLHVGWALKHQRYDPGLLTGALALLPIGLLGIRKLVKDPEVSGKAIAGGVVGGLGIAAGMMPAMKYRLKRRRAQGRARKLQPIWNFFA